MIKDWWRLRKFSKLMIRYKHPAEQFLRAGAKKLLNMMEIKNEL